MSIVVATWNAARTLERLLESIRAQSFRDWELVIADGGSTDGTVDILERNEGMIAHWQSQRDGGIYDAWNQAIAHARGRYFCFLGADDAWTGPQALQALAAAALEGDVDLVSSRGVVVDSAGKALWRFGNPWDRRAIGRRMVVCHPGLLHHRRLFEQYGGFDASYRIAGDLEFLLRLGPGTRSVHVPLETVRIENAGISRNLVRRRLAEQRRALAASPRHGRLVAWLVWTDKMARYPFARLFGIPH